ncbi:MAG: aspartate aminotransferase family protein [Candidatus Hodarchaeales archaeon]|jgi:acetylornithine/succinyldiaminopimelate/putrescine aminotransferase
MGFIGSLTKEEIIKAYAAHVSSGKVDFYELIGLDFVLGHRVGPWMTDTPKEDHEGPEIRLLNCHCNGGVFNLGHRHPDVVNVLAKAIHELDIGNHHLISEQRAVLAKSLLALTPNAITRVVFGVGGGEAIDFAIKLARAHTKKHKIIHAEGGYHGHTGFALAAGAERFKAPFEPLVPGYVAVPFGDSGAIKAAIDAETAAVLLETIPATLGMPMPPDSYYAEIREICDSHGALLILDEIQTGLGRTGKLWAFDHYNVVPDIFCIAKGLSGGLYPISATLYKEELDHFCRENPFIHVSTYGGADLGCPVALKVLEISSSPDFLERVNQIATELKTGLETLRKKYSDILLEIRQKGLFIGLKMADEGYGPVMSLALVRNGVFAVFADNDRSVLQFLPPLILKDEEITYVLENLDKAFNWAKENPEYLEFARHL